MVEPTDGAGWLGHLTRLDPPLQHQNFGNMAGQHTQNVCDKTSRGVHVDIADNVTVALSEEACIHLKVTPHICWKCTDVSVFIIRVDERVGWGG